MISEKQEAKAKRVKLLTFFKSGRNLFVKALSPCHLFTVVALHTLLDLLSDVQKLSSHATTSQASISDAPASNGFRN